MLAEGTKEKDARLNIPIPNGPRLGNKVIEASGLNKAFGEKLLVENLSFQLPPAGIVGIVGPNGAGKTTLFRMVMGEETPDKGSIEVGETVKIGYVDQRHQDIDPNKTVWEVVSGGNEQIEIGGQLFNSRAYVSKFNFNGSDQQKKCGVLSGGSATGCTSAMTLKTEANVLVVGRAYERHRRQYVARARGRQSRDLRDVRSGHQPRPLLPWTESAPTSSRLRETAKRIGLKGPTASTKKTRRSDLGDEGPKRIKYRKLVARMTLGPSVRRTFCPFAHGAALHLGSMATAVA